MFGSNRVEHQLFKTQSASTFTFVGYHGLNVLGFA